MKEWIKNMREHVWMAGDPQRDRSRGLVICGTAEIVLGMLCFSLAMLLLILVSSSGLGGMKPIHFKISMGGLFGLTAWFITIGMGSIKATRWARALVLVGAWITIFFGTLVLALVLYILPEAHALLSDSGIFSPMVALGVLYFTIFILFLLQVIFPFAAILFYSLAGVHRTCERKHPEPCWTDRVPLPLLAMGFISVMGCLSVFFGVSTNYVVFFFGKILTGGLGLAVLISISICCAYVGWGAFTRRMHAWWGGYAIVLLTSGSMMLTFSELDMELLYRRMGYTAEQMEQLVSLGPLNPAMLTFVSGIWGVMACFFLVWVRDCFQPEKDKVIVKSYEQRQAEEEASKPAISAEPTKPRMRVGD